MRVIIKPLLLLWLLALLLTSSIAQAAPPDIKAGAAVLIDAKTGQILYEKNAHTRLAPASTTKILTAIIAIESGRLDEEVKVSARAAGTAGSSMHLQIGQKILLRELVTGLMMRSGNDAAVAIAEYLAGSVEDFVIMMNSKAQALGAYNSHFRNPHGLTAAGHYSSAFDLAWLARYAMLNPLFADIVSTRETSIDWFDQRGHEHDQNLRNTNKLLWMLEEADGVKTGTTGEAGPCLVSSATRDNQKLIAVVLHDHARWYDSMVLLKWGFTNFKLFDYAAQGDVVNTIPVEQGLSTEIDAIVADQAALVVDASSYGTVTVEVDLPTTIKAPVYQGQKIGEIVFFVKEKAVKTVDIIAAQDVEERTPVRVFLNHLTNWFRQLSAWGLL
ncbi:serine-type D-Ala-D-Ala carboxypeptidase [Sporomusaceae bacterium FL31]|nr:serine-type D-Ala-D-Ala carboxypeptidase [Sporomusaceae bacterium FL31]GCE34579.1 serine-type D-Ala-D-Ala carboxypeptidase [Sporomusaceae bacterium]